MLNRFLMFMTAICLGTLLLQLHVPIPFLLGGLITALACKTAGHHISLTWPKKWREYALMIAGYSIGAKFTADTWYNFLAEFSGVIEATLIIMAVSLVLAFITAKIFKENLKTCIIGMLPGGMTLSMLLCEEDKEVNPNAVMVMQVVRLLGVVISVPFLVVWLLHARVLESSLILNNTVGVRWLICIPLTVLGSFIAAKIHIPTPKLLGSIIATALFSMLVGDVQSVPFFIMAAAQVSIGLFMGMQLDTDKIVKTRKMLPFIIFSTAVLIAVSIFMANILSARYGFSLITAFLAMAPGGIAEMSLAGISMNENVSVILTYQLVRVLAINLFIPPLLGFCFKNKIAKV